jgi:organic radical activating enzyme
MLFKNINHEDFVNYKVCSMFLGFPSCNWKCERDCGMTGLCQNAALAHAPSIEISVSDIVTAYLANPISRAIVCGGLEPFDSVEDLLSLITELRKFTLDDIVIYTGYNKEELSQVLPKFEEFHNIIIKFGRFVPNQEKHYDEVLGVWLASNNQYAERIS